MKIIISILLFSCILLLVSSSCNENSTNNPDIGNFKVKFKNENGSAFAISSIELLAMGKAPDSNPSGEWSSNILKNGKKIQPGGFEMFDLNIPSGHWCQYRLGVIDSSGNEVFIDKQPGYVSQWKLPITHWGADTRTVSVSIIWDKYTNLINVNGLSDFAGIQE